MYCIQFTVIQLTCGNYKLKDQIIQIYRHYALIKKLLLNFFFLGNLMLSNAIDLI